MNYVVTGAAGNVSRPLAQKLLSAGHEVVVIGRDAGHLKPLTDKGAKAKTGSVEDTKFLKDAFSGADAVYLMIPPQYAAGEGLDAYRQIAANYAEAIESAGVRNAIMLSSIGAHLSEGCGPVSGLHYAEQELNSLDDVNVMHLRPGFFYVNFYGLVQMIKYLNFIGGNYGDASTRMIFSHPNDVADEAAEALMQLSFKGHSVRYIASDDRTTGEVTKVLGSAIGKPDLAWVPFTDQQAYEGMIQAGFPKGMAEKYTEMGRAMRTGIMWQDYLKHPPQQFGKTNLEDFAKEFAGVYKAG